MTESLTTDITSRPQWLQGWEWSKQKKNYFAYHNITAHINEKKSKNKGIFEVLWTVDAVLSLLESLLHFKVDKINWGVIFY
jgi:hypothetical protein